MRLKNAYDERPQRYRRALFKSQSSEGNDSQSNKQATVEVQKKVGGKPRAQFGAKSFYNLNKGASEKIKISAKKDMSSKFKPRPFSGFSRVSLPLTSCAEQMNQEESMDSVESVVSSDGDVSLQLDTAEDEKSKEKLPEKTYRSRRIAEKMARRKEEKEAESAKKSNADGVIEVKENDVNLQENEEYKVENMLASRPEEWLEVKKEKVEGANEEKPATITLRRAVMKKVKDGGKTVLKRKKPETTVVKKYVD